MAARDWGLASSLAKLAPAAFRDGHEYEDDFCYALVLHQLIAQSPDVELALSLLRRAESTADKVGRARVPVARALVQRDQKGFDEAFAELLEARRGEIRGAEARGQIANVANIVQRRVFVEGIALLNLAERAALTTEAEYPMCPSLARMAKTQPADS
jgi:hypothetical protein